MSIYNTFAIDQHQKPKPMPGHKVQHHAWGTTPGPMPGFPDLYVNIYYKSDSKTHLINPANVWGTKDVIIMVSPFNEGLSEDFHAPTIDLHKEVVGPLLNFSLKCSVSLLGSAKAHVGFKDFFSIDKEVKSKTVIVKVYGWLNTVTGEADFTCVRAGNFDKLHVEY